MPSTRKADSGFWLCAGFTLLSALVSAAFSLLALRMQQGHDYALYAASRSVPLPLAVLFALAIRTHAGIKTLAIVMTMVQLFDGVIGFRLNDPGRAYGPLAIAAINFGLLLWMVRSDRKQTS